MQLSDQQLGDNKDVHGQVVNYGISKGGHDSIHHRYAAADTTSPVVLGS